MLELRHTVPQCDQSRVKSFNDREERAEADVYPSVYCNTTDMV